MTQCARIQVSFGHWSDVFICCFCFVNMCLNWCERDELKKHKHPIKLIVWSYPFALFFYVPLYVYMPSLLSLQWWCVTFSSQTSEWRSKIIVPTIYNVSAPAPAYIVIYENVKIQCNQIESSAREIKKKHCSCSMHAMVPFRYEWNGPDKNECSFDCNHLKTIAKWLPSIIAEKHFM